MDEMFRPVPRVLGLTAAVFAYDTRLSLPALVYNHDAEDPSGPVPFFPHPIHHLNRKSAFPRQHGVHTTRYGFWRAVQICSGQFCESWPPATMSCNFARGVVNAPICRVIAYRPRKGRGTTDPTARTGKTDRPASRPDRYLGGGDSGN